ncbi:MAG: O-antigen ligase family protein [Bacteroidota bacterium]
MSSKITVYYSALLGVFAFLMLVFPRLIAIGFILFLPYIIWGLVQKSIRFRWTYLNMFFVLFYLVYVSYALFTRHPDWAGRYIENKLSFLILPLLLSFRPKEKFAAGLPIGMYLLGIACLLAQGYFASVHAYSHKGLGLNSFLSSEFSVVHHPTYFSVYLLLGIALALYALRSKQPYFREMWVYPLCALLFVAYFQCLSLAGILFAVALLGILFVRFIYKKWGKWPATLSVLVVISLSYLSVNYIPRIEGEWNAARGYAKIYLRDPAAFVKTTDPESGSQERLIMWTIAGQAFAAYPMGVGTGNVDEVLGTFLRRSNQDKLAAKELNPHNQYLQTGVETGIFGLLILLGILTAASYYGFKARNWILVIMVASLAFNMLFESMLQRQSGIVFYTFVLTLLACYPFQKSGSN